MLGSTLALCSQTQDRLFVATNPNEGGGGTGAGSAERKSSAASAAAMGEVVGDDSMVVGKGIMIKGDVDNCAVRFLHCYVLPGHNTLEKFVFLFRCLVVLIFACLRTEFSSPCRCRDLETNAGNGRDERGTLNSRIVRLCPHNLSMIR